MGGESKITIFPSTNDYFITSRGRNMEALPAAARVMLPGIVDSNDGPIIVDRSP